MWRCSNIKELQINEDIREKEVRLIGADGEQIGVVDTKKALEMAISKKLDLVVVSPNAKPPVCKIIDYGKYRYETIKKAKEAKKKQAVVNVKEIRMSPNIDTHDLETKAKTASKFFKSGDKVKVTVRFRGREMAHTDMGKDVLMDFAKLVEEFGTIDKKPMLEGRNYVMIMNPKVEE